MERMLTKALITVGALLILVLGISYWGISYLRRENKRIDAKLHATEQRYQDEQGRHVTVVKQLEFTKGEFRDMSRRAKEDSSRITSMERQALRDKKVIDDLHKKLGDVSSITGGTIHAGSTNTTPYTLVRWRDRYLPVIDTIRTKHWFLAFKADTLGKVNVTSRYTNRFYHILDRAKVRSNGDHIKHPRLPWYWFKEYEYFVTVTSDDTASYIDNVLNMNF